jgi:hypothetical protein
MPGMQYYRNGGKNEKKPTTNEITNMKMKGE